MVMSISAGFCLTFSIHTVFLDSVLIPRGNKTPLLEVSYQMLLQPTSDTLTYTWKHVEMFLGVANILEGQFSIVSRDTIEGAKNKIATVKGLNVLIQLKILKVIYPDVKVVNR